MSVFVHVEGGGGGGWANMAGEGRDLKLWCNS